MATDGEKMNTKIPIIAILAVFIIGFGLTSGCTDTQTSSTGIGEEETITITDALGREVAVPAHPERVVCSGAGTLRYLTYLQAEDTLVGVDDIELGESQFNARPYWFANPQFQTDYPLIGEFRGNDDPEKIVAANPQVIFKSSLTSGDDADELQHKTGIPVVAIDYGDLDVYRDDMDQALRLMGTVMGKEDRAEEVISYFDDMAADLDSRTNDIPEEERPTVYVGGIAYRGPHGTQSTEPAYPPFSFVNAQNVAAEVGTTHADVAKEKIIEWDPDVIFIDLMTLQTTPSATDELRDDPSYSQLSAVQSGEVYGLLPYNCYTANQGSIMADAYFIGKVLYPDRFSDVDPAEKADEIYTFLVGEPVFDQLNEMFGNTAFTRIDVS
jgi:iron complex transport system substrate-binding protein